MDIMIRGHALPGDFLDGDFVDRYTAEANKMRANMAAARNAQYDTVGAAYRGLCRVIDSFFDAVFGAGTSAALFDVEASNVRAHYEALNELTAAEKAQVKELNDLSNKSTQMQAAQANREQRRAADSGKVVTINGGSGGKKRRRH